MLAHRVGLVNPSSYHLPDAPPPPKSPPPPEKVSEDDIPPPPLNPPPHPPSHPVLPRPDRTPLDSSVITHAPRLPSTAAMTAITSPVGSAIKKESTPLTMPPRAFRRPPMSAPPTNAPIRSAMNRLSTAPVEGERLGGAGGAT